MSSESALSPTVEPKFFADAESALACVRTIYDGQVRWLADRFGDYAAGKALTGRQRAFYPYVQLTTGTHARLDSRLSYGFVRGPGVFRASLTRPDLFEDYYREQFEALLKNHRVSLEVGLSNRAIPIHFALGENLHIEAQLTPERLPVVGDTFDLPNLAELDDAVPNGAYFLPTADRQQIGRASCRERV